MKKRLAALALCIVFTGTLMAAPKARAVVVEAAAATLGIAVLGSYMTAIGLNIGADTGETVSSGLTSMVSDYLTDTGSTDTAQSWLEYIAGFASMPVAGSLRLPASVVKTIGFFVDWLTEKFGLDEAGDTAVGYSDLPIITSLGVPLGASSKDDAVALEFGVTYPLSTGYSFKVELNTLSSNGQTHSYLYVIDPNGVSTLYGTFLYKFEAPVFYSLFGSYENDYYGYFYQLTIFDGDEAATVGLLRHRYIGASLSEDILELEVTRAPEFSNIANDLTDDSDKELNIVFPETITNLDDLAAAVPDQIAAGTLAPTYELTGTGEGSDTEDDTTVGLLQSILQGVKAIPDAFTNSLTDVFTPSQEAVDSLAAEVDLKLPLIPTLKNFGSGLVHNLEHPETCANGLGLTTIVDLEKGRGTYLGNTKHELLDVSWYLEYKPLVDDIIVGFCWLCFLWNCYGALPRIIHGEGSVVKVASILQETLEGDDDP